MSNLAIPLSSTLVDTTPAGVSQEDLITYGISKLETSLKNAQASKRKELNDLEQERKILRDQFVEDSKKLLRKHVLPLAVKLKEQYLKLVELSPRNVGRFDKDVILIDEKDCVIVFTPAELYYPIQIALFVHEGDFRGFSITKKDILEIFKKVDDTYKANLIPIKTKKDKITKELGNLKNKLENIVSTERALKATLIEKILSGTQEGMNLKDYINKQVEGFSNL